MSDSIVDHVSETALWVAVYRAQETARPDALFKDPWAGILAGDRGQNIEKKASRSKYVKWAVVTRTVIIDRAIEKLISEGVDTVLNLGCGLDTRPYRMKLPPELKWIEVDFPHMISFKKERLENEKANCHLEQIGLDLSKIESRQELFKRINGESKKVLILTEGVTPYLSEQDVASLADDMKNQSQFKYWITDYNAPKLIEYMNKSKRKTELKNAPFLFNPKNWLDFYQSHGWKLLEMHYISEVSEKIGRPVPIPWIIKIVMSITMSKTQRQEFRKYNGYAILERTN